MINVTMEGWHHVLPTPCNIDIYVMYKNSFTATLNDRSLHIVLLIIL